MSQYEIELYNEDDNETQNNIHPEFRRIRSIGYTKECIVWNPDIKCG
jgi:hypothetical protein